MYQILFPRWFFSNIKFWFKILRFLVAVTLFVFFLLRIMVIMPNTICYIFQFDKFIHDYRELAEPTTYSLYESDTPIDAELKKDFINVERKLKKTFYSIKKYVHTVLCSCFLHLCYLSCKTSKHYLRYCLFVWQVFLI